MKYGVSGLDRTLMANNLIDEFSLSIMPTYVGGGGREGRSKMSILGVNLDLVDTHQFKNGRSHPYVRSQTLLSFKLIEKSRSKRRNRRDI